MDIQQQLEILAKGQQSLLEIVQHQQKIIDGLVNKTETNVGDGEDSSELKDDEVSPAMKTIIAERKAAAEAKAAQTA